MKPFEQEFTLAQSQAMGGGAGSQQLDDLVAAQKEIIVATWKLDRRAPDGRARQSAEDIRSVVARGGRAEDSASRRPRARSGTSTMRDPRQRGPGRRGPAPGGPRAGQTRPEEDAMTAAAAAMGRAVDSLDARSRPIVRFRRRWRRSTTC